MSYPRTPATKFEISAYRKGVIASLVASGGPWGGQYDKKGNVKFMRKSFDKNPYDKTSKGYRCWKMGFETCSLLGEIDYDILGKELQEYFKIYWAA